MHRLSTIAPWVAAASLVGCSEYDFHGKSDSESGREQPDAAPQIAVSPPALDLGLLPVGAVDEGIITIENVGSAELHLDRLSLASGAPWSLTAVGATVLQPGESTTVAAVFGPSDRGVWPDELAVLSDDPTQPTVGVPLTVEVVEAEEEDVGVMHISPTSWTFAWMEVGETDLASFTVSNIGDAPLTVDSVDFSATSTELMLDPASVPSLPLVLAPAASFDVGVHYVPIDTEADEGAVLAVSADGQEQQANVAGNARDFEGFSTGWYVWDPRVPVSTTAHPDYQVDHHGDEDVYYYEDSGAHGMSGSTDLPGDFAILRDYVIANAGAPTVPSGPFNWNESSSVSQFAEATFTYFLCDFYLPPDANPAAYTIETGAVDDGIRVLVNGQILGHQKLAEASGQWSLDHAVPGEVNTLVVILVDDAAVNKALYGLGFWYDGALVEG